MKLLVCFLVSTLAVSQIFGQDMSGNAFTDSETPFAFNFGTNNPQPSSSSNSNSAFNFNIPSPNSGSSGNSGGVTAPSQPVNTPFTFNSNSNNAGTPNMQNQPNNQLNFGNSANPPQPQNTAFNAPNQPQQPTAQFPPNNNGQMNQPFNSNLNQQPFNSNPNQPFNSNPNQQPFNSNPNQQSPQVPSTNQMQMQSQGQTRVQRQRPMQMQGQGQIQGQGQMQVQGQGQGQGQTTMPTGPGGFALGTNQWNRMQAQQRPRQFMGPTPQTSIPNQGFGNQQPQFAGPPQQTDSFLEFGTSGNDVVTFQDQGLSTGTIDNIMFRAGPNQEPIRVQMGQIGGNQPQFGQTFGGVNVIRDQGFGTTPSQSFFTSFDPNNANTLPQTSGFMNPLFGLGGPGFSGGMFAPPPPQQNSMFGGFGSSFGMPPGGFGFGAPQPRRGFFSRLFGL